MMVGMDVAGYIAGTTSADPLYLSPTIKQINQIKSKQCNNVTLVLVSSHGTFYY